MIEFWPIHQLQSLLIAVVAITSYFAAIFFLLIRARLRIQSSVVFWSILYLFTWGSGIWVENYTVYNWLRQFSETNNLVWYLGWMLVILAHAFVLEAFCQARNQNSRLNLIAVVIAGTLLTVIFTTQLQFLPERDVHAFATNQWELAFMAVFCGYCGFACGLLASWHRPYRQEPNKIRRIREMLLRTTCIGAVFFYAFRIVTAAGGWYLGRTELPNMMYLTVVIIQSLVGLLQILPFLSGPMLVKLFAPLIQKWETNQFQYLHTLNDQLAALTDPNIGKLVLGTGYGIRTLLVSILERKTSLLLLGTVDNALVERLKQVDDSQDAEFLAHQYALIGAEI